MLGDILEILLQGADALVAFLELEQFRNFRVHVCSSWRGMRLAGKVLVRDTARDGLESVVVPGTGLEPALISQPDPKFYTIGYSFICGKDV